MNNIAKDITIKIAGLGEYKLSPIKSEPPKDVLASLLKIIANAGSTKPTFTEATPKNDLIISKMTVKPNRSGFTDIAEPRRILADARICERCGKPYMPRSGVQKFCSACAPEARREYGRKYYYTRRDMLRAKEKSLGKNVTINL